MSVTSDFYLARAAEAARDAEAAVLRRGETMRDTLAAEKSAREVAG